MLVPSHEAQRPARAGSDERIPTPGAVTSGFIWSEIGVGPPEEKPAISSTPKPRPVPDAATVIASGAVPGEPTEPSPNSPKSLPAAMVGTTPSFAALSIAVTT